MRFLLPLTLGFGLALAAQSAPAPAAAANAAAEPRFGLGLDLSSLGIGAAAAARVTQGSNLRLVFHDFDYGHPFTDDGLDYTARLDLRSLQVSYDWFFAGSFHLSPGFLAWDDNHATATVLAPAGKPFTLGGVTYTSSASNPVNGNGALNLARSGPMLTLGWGNLVPRSGSHFSLSLEAGAAYQGAPNVTLNLAGTACDSTGTVCEPVSSYPGLQANVVQEQNKLNGKLKEFKVYPIATVGFGYSFGH